MARTGMQDNMTPPQLISEARREVRLLATKAESVVRESRRVDRLLELAERDARQKGSAA